MNRSRKVDVTLQNEYLTRQRVDRIEPVVGALMVECQASEAFRKRDLWGRLRWVLTGK